MTNTSNRPDRSSSPFRTLTTRLALGGVLAAALTGGLAAPAASGNRVAIAALEADAAATEPTDRSNLEATLTPPPVTESSAAAPDTPSVLGCPIRALVSDGSFATAERAPNLRNRFGRSVYLILQSEIAAAGITPGTQLSGIGWSFRTAPNLSGNNNLIVYMENTANTTNTKSTTWATAISAMTIVHNMSTTIPNVTGGWDILFSGGPFTYTGGGLYVAFDAEYPVGTLSTSTVVACNTTGLANGLLGAEGAVAPTTVMPSNFRPETRFTPTNATILNDGSVDLVFSYGSLPRDLVGPQAVQALVSNRGANALTNFPVTLNVIGANSFSNTVNVASLAECSGPATVTFAPYVASNLGSDTLTVTVPADQVNGNNSKAVPVNVTGTEYSFKYPGTTASGGVGVNGTTNAIVGKLTTTFATNVTAVTLEFPVVGATTYRVAVYGDSGGLPGAPLYVDAADRTVSVAGPVTIPIPPTAVGPGDFYVGIQQTNTTSVNLGFDSEVPIRSGKIFGTIPLTPTNWFDFSPLNNFKINVGAILDPCAGGPSVCNDGNPCTLDSCSSVSGCSHQPDAPGEATGTAVAADKATYSWSPTPGATKYDVVRGSTAAFPVGPGGVDEVCFNDLPGPSLVDPVAPAPGGGFWYLPRAENACGNGTYGTQGVNGAPGAPRITATCP